ncbi:MAG: hypothetical protein HY913_03195 [Desulfomonile tiedjei]|nr:hypothetical protein [Desulfomonile tiedjei]
MSRDFEDKEKNLAANKEDVSPAESASDETHDKARRDFLKDLGKWSGIAIGIALVGSAIGSTDADADDRSKPQESWRCARCRCRCRCKCIL